jgi:hypothetical protein
MNAAFGLRFDFFLAAIALSPDGLVEGTRFPSGEQSRS